MIFRNFRNCPYRNCPYRIGLADARHDDGGGVGAGGSGVVLSQGQVPAGVCVDRQDSRQQFLKSSMYNYYIMSYTMSHFKAFILGNYTIM